MSNGLVTAQAILILVDGFIKIAFNLWSSIRQIEGAEPIPSWDEILDKNKQLQDKIDAEKGV